MSSRRSGRRSKGGKAKFVVAVLLVLAGAGTGTLLFGGDKPGVSQGAINDLIPSLDVTGSVTGATAEQPQAPPAEDQSLAGFHQTLAEANRALQAQGEPREKALREAYTKLAPALEGALPLPEREAALPVLHAITGELFLSPVHNEFSENYVVRSGDSFAVIASRAGIGMNLLFDLNNRPRGSRTLHPNENLKLPKGAVSVVVRKRDFTTSVYFGDHLVRQYIVAHGSNNNTPEGSTTVNRMALDPEKHSRGPNDPVNEMKLRWIGLENYASGRSGIGFHGTQYPDSIPGMTSRGCIRMKDADVIELYDIVRSGTKVEIKA